MGHRITNTEIAGKSDIKAKLTFIGNFSTLLMVSYLAKYELQTHYLIFINYNLFWLIFTTVIWQLFLMTHFTSTVNLFFPIKVFLKYLKRNWIEAEYVCFQLVFMTLSCFCAVGEICADMAWQINSYLCKQELLLRHTTWILYIFGVLGQFWDSTD